jgi:hypothetical protein
VTNTFSFTPMENKMRIIFVTRPLKFLFLRNYWGIRKGELWVIIPEEKYAFMIDMGMLTIGYAILRK